MTYTFEYDADEVYFAYSMPYTYTDLRKDLDELVLEQKSKKSQDQFLSKISP